MEGCCKMSWGAANVLGLAGWSCLGLGKYGGFGRDWGRTSQSERPMVDTDDACLTLQVRVSDQRYLKCCLNVFLLASAPPVQLTYTGLPAPLLF